MTEYTKPVIAAAVKTLTNYEATFADGKGAVNAFKAKAVLEGKIGANTVLIPFHAVKTFAESISELQVSIESDAYCGNEEDTQSSDDSGTPVTPITEH